MIEEFSPGDEFDFSSLEGAGENTPVWYKFTVGEACNVEIGVGNCGTSLGSEVTLEIFDSCDGHPEPPLEARKLEGEHDGPEALTTATGNCGDNAFIDGFTTGQTGPTVYYIKLSTAVGYEGVVNVVGSISGTAGSCGDPHFQVSFWTDSHQIFLRQIGLATTSWLTILIFFSIPLLQRWTIDERDSFHGECDLVLLKKENVEEDVDLDVQIRTTIKDSYSYIESAAVKIGDDAMEFQMDAVYLNGQKKADSEFPMDLGHGNKITLVPANLVKNRRYFHVTLLDRISLDIHSTKHFMGVKIGGSPKYLDGSVGILGDYKTGKMISRTGAELSHFEDFGFEWQVSPDDPKIFMDAREPQLPYERCRMPAFSAASRRRKLRGTDRELYEKAVEACTQNHIPANVQSCVDDVIFTGELDLADRL